MIINNDMLKTYHLSNFEWGVYHKVKGEHVGSAKLGEFAQTWQGVGEVCPVCTIAVMQSHLDSLPSKMKNGAMQWFKPEFNWEHQETELELMREVINISWQGLVYVLPEMEGKELAQAIQNDDESVLEILEKRLQCLGESHHMYLPNIKNKRTTSGGYGNAWSLGSGGRGRG